MSNYCKECYKKQEEIEQLKQALQEIRDIARKCPLCEDCSGVEDCERYCGEEIAHELCSTKQMNNILDKINEVIGAE